MKFNEALPVIISICVILLVAAVQKSSKTVAAVTATMPVNIPLSLWIVYSYNQQNQKAISQYAQGLAIGILPTVAFTFAIWLATRAGLKLIPIIVVGYTTWVVVLLVVLGVKRVLGT